MRTKLTLNCLAFALDMTNAVPQSLASAVTENYWLSRQDKQGGLATKNRCELG
jgi:hypothetical protein